MLPRPLQAMLILIQSLKESWTRRDLVRQLAHKDVASRYRGSAMGLLWSLFNPLLMLAVYTIAFQDILGVRWEQVGDSRGGFAAFLFTGLIVHAMFSECLSRAPALVLENPNYVKKIRFPLQNLSWVLLVSALFHALASTLVLIAFKTVFDGVFPVMALLVPFVLAPPAILLLGIIWILSAAGVYLRDVAQIMTPVCAAMLFLSPVFYPSTAVPEVLAPFMMFNPLALIIEQLRLLLIHGSPPDWSALAIYTAVAIAIALLGLALFQKARAGFAEVL